MRVSLNASSCRGRCRQALRIWSCAAFIFVFAGAFLCSIASTTVAAAESPHRIASINVCTDQLLFKIADREQIAALSVFAADPSYSAYAAEVKASGIPLIKGTAEEVLKLKPSLVLAGSWTRGATREQLKLLGIPLTQFDPGESVAATIHAIRELARVTGHQDRGDRMIAEIETALAAATPSAAVRPITVLHLQRRGFTSGRDTLIGELLRRLGVTNAADTLGITAVGEVSLEAILTAKPDALIVLQPGIEPVDQGAALLLHPVLMQAYPPERRIVLPYQLTECGGPALAEAVRLLARGVQRAPR